MPASSIHSTAQTIGGFARKIAAMGHPDLKVVLDDHVDHKIYTTLDSISGRIEITAPFNVRFDEIRITFEGIAKTHVEIMSPATSRARTNAVHNFLRLTMPLRDSDYPTPRVAESGRTYKLPFHFVIPEHLLPRSCQHTCVADHVQQAHLQLPPSMGDKEVSGQDDMAPEMAKVQYGVRVRVLSHLDESNEKIVIGEKVRKIHVVPAQAEAPPMVGNEDFKLTKTKMLRKGVFSGKLGKITVSAEQPSALMLPKPSEASTTPATTMAKVKLVFEPHSESSQPPRLGGLTSKLRTSTFFAVKPIDQLLFQGGPHIDFDPFRGVYESNTTINSRCVESVSWVKKTSGLRRKNSASSTSSSDLSDASPSGNDSGIYYTAEILVPITLPSTKKWVPTFHTCVISRVYQLNLSLGVHSMGSGIPSTSITLHLPIQIGANGGDGRRGSLTAAEAAAELADAEEFLRPRYIEVPAPEFVGNSVIHDDLPPSYFATVPARQAVH